MCAAAYDSVRTYTLLLLLAFCLNRASLQAQTPRSLSPTVSADTPSLDSLCSCVRHRYTLLLDVELQALATTRRGQWIKYLPNLGITYDIAGRPRPAISTNSSILYTARRDKQALTAQRESIRKRLALEEARVIADLIRKYQRLVAERERANVFTEIAEIDRELFYLYERQYENRELTPEEFLLKKKAFLLQEMRGQEQREKVTGLVYAVEDLAGCLPFTIPSPNQGQ